MTIAEIIKAIADCTSIEDLFELGDEITHKQFQNKLVSDAYDTALDSLPPRSTN